MLLPTTRTTYAAAARFYYCYYYYYYHYYHYHYLYILPLLRILTTSWSPPADPLQQRGASPVRCTQGRDRIHLPPSSTVVSQSPFLHNVFHSIPFSNKSLPSAAPPRPIPASSSSFSITTQSQSSRVIALFHLAAAPIFLCNSNIGAGFIISAATTDFDK